jgi:hypothetical protein
VSWPDHVIRTRAEFRASKQGLRIPIATLSRVHRSGDGGKKTRLARQSTK